ncbi:outer membrane protein OmpK [Acinetobacter shaoyimingii]|uniref:Ion channel protein Tsx n=1 Tax=Acinetobacter shaoyimingii TaxID=2715164 RepID=A0A6G8RRQ7_9GAMM|nr:outer membrane protein OmpK [Acinetobacter shaoyimingii]NHB56902.1 ion channel protein Tsx [Acinetobacter shaoyimingii]QIO04591.1 ion channel protein Tsx [Acinetobacter shaoyimingii]
MKFNQIIATCALASAASLSQAAPIWQDFSVSALYGSNYELGSEDRTTVTFEYTAKFKYADLFFFNDHQWEDDTQTNYFEFSPRFSLGAISGKKLEFGPIKDVLVATTWESNNSGVNFDNFLYGIGFDLAIPKFQYAQLNFYKANNELGKDDYQMTFVYGIPFKIGNEEFLADAFLDWSTGEGPDHASELNWTSQYKWNVGKHISPKTKLYVGVEHSVWNNKFGVPGVRQNDVSALVKYHF